MVPKEIYEKYNMASLEEYKMNLNQNHRNSRITIIKIKEE